jgi:hypothetical protein
MCAHESRGDIVRQPTYLEVRSGRYSGRGYWENQLVRDNGVIGSVEARVPVVRHVSWADVVKLASFVDAGTAWNTKLATPDPRALYSIGLDMRWALGRERQGEEGRKRYSRASRLRYTSC